MHKIFTYGTLKRGQPNHHFITEGKGIAKFIGSAKTRELYPLVTAGRYNTPFLLDVKGQGKNVKGEVYEVDDQMLDLLNGLESHPDFYIKDSISIQYVTDSNDKDITQENKQEKMHAYFLHNFKSELLSLEFLESFDNSLVNYTILGDRPKQDDPRAHWWDVKHKTE